MGTVPAQPYRHTSQRQKSGVVMSETKFTPGPWESSTKPFDNGHGEHVFTVCSISKVEGLAEQFICDIDSKEDALLIATAPELYAALENCISQIKALCGRDDVPDGAMEALKKARGES
jgi:hypothetical protein